jgi:hypothetical protein
LNPQIYTNTLVYYLIISDAIGGATIFSNILLKILQSNREKMLPMQVVPLILYCDRDLLIYLVFELVVLYLVENGYKYYPFF